MKLNLRITGIWALLLVSAGVTGQSTSILNAPHVKGNTEGTIENNSPTSGSWVAATSMLTPVIRYAFAQNGEDMYVISGVSPAFAVTTAVTHYNATTDTWNSLAPIPLATEAPAGAIYAGKIYVASGNGSNALYIYDISGNSWTTGAARPVGNSYGAAAGAYNGKFYVVGSGSPLTNTTSVYDIGTNTWSAGNAAPTPYLLGGYTTVGQYLYVIGGYTSSPAANSTVSMRLDMVTGTWTTGPTWTPARADFALASNGFKIVAIGGDADAGGYFDATNIVSELDISTWPAGAWIASPNNLPSNRQANQAGFYSTGRSGGEIWSTSAYTGAAVVGDHLYRSLAPLPVTFISLNAYKKNAGVQVDWKVANEPGISSYELERSTNGADFSRINTIGASPANHGSYTSFDNVPNRGVNYYRVKSLDVNGQRAYTNVVKVVLNTSSGNITIAPNPITGGEVALQFADEAKGLYNISVINASGQVICKTVITHEGGSAVQKFSLPLSLANGIYSLEITDGNNFKQTQQLIVKK